LIKRLDVLRSRFRGAPDGEFRVSKNALAEEWQGNFAERHLAGCARQKTGAVLLHMRSRAAADSMAARMIEEKIVI
jgi:hypothetical protein